jgi:predicted dienelactone hydrolase
MVAAVVGLTALAAATASPAATAPPAPDRRPYTTAATDEILVDDTRPTPAVPALGVDAAPSRTIPVRVVYPARGERPDDVRPAKGRFPLILYAPGNGANRVDLPPVVASWAEQGYVVVVPEFPVSSRARQNLAAVDDWAAQPADVRFVLDTALRGEGIGGTGPMIDRRHVGLAGHSLGAVSVLGVAFGSDPDPRVDAVVTFAGVPLLADADVSSRAVPLLLFHGDDDPVIPADQSRAMFAAAAGPRALVLVTGGGHSTYLRDTEEAIRAFLLDATTTFWDTTLRRGRGVAGDPDAVMRALAVPGRATVEVGSAPNLEARRSG